MGNGLSLVAYCGGGGSAKTGVNNAILVRAPDGDTRRIDTGDDVGVALKIVQNPQTGMIFLMVAFFATIPAIIGESIGPIDALGRSWSLTQGHRWKLFAMILIYGVVAMILSSAISGATMPFVMLGDMDPASPFDGMMPIMALQSFLGSLTLIITYPAIAATYHNLRIAKEGIRQDQVSDIFE